MSGKIGPKRYLRELSAALGSVWKEGARWIGYLATYMVPVLILIINSALARFGLAIEWVSASTTPQVVAVFGVLWLLLGFLIFAPYVVWRERTREFEDLQAGVDERHRHARRVAILENALNRLGSFLRIDAKGKDVIDAFRADLSAALGEIADTFHGVLSPSEIVLFNAPLRPSPPSFGNEPDLAHLRRVVNDRLQTIRELLAKSSGD